MRRRRTGWLLAVIFPCLALTQSGYDAQPIDRPSDAGQFSARSPVPRGYQPPPSPLMFEAPRSRYNSANGEMDISQYRGHTSFRSNYPDFQKSIIVPHANAQYVESQARANEHYRNQTVTSALPSRRPFAPTNYVEQWKEKQRTPSSLPFSHPVYSSRLIYTPEASSNPPASRPQQEVQAAALQSGENPPDVLNNIIIHIYLNAKGRQSHTVASSGPIKGLFGIGTSHGGPGTHTNPIVITKDFDRDTLEFIEEDRARHLVDEGPANIVEVKAMVSTPDRKMENTLNKAVNTELNRAIPTVMNRMQGPMANLDNELRKELEQALVDELAKNLGETIDEIGNAPSEEDLGTLIEEGFNEISKEFTATTSSPTSAPSSTRRFTVTTTKTPRTTNTIAITIRTTTRTHSTASTTSPTTTPRTTVASEDEMIKESSFEQVPTPFQEEPATERTIPPRTITVTTSPRITTTAPWWMTTVPWWLTTRSTPVSVRTGTPSTILTTPMKTATRPTTTTTRFTSTTTRSSTHSTRMHTEARTRPSAATSKITTRAPATSSPTEAPPTTRVFMMTSSIPHRRKTTEIAFTRSEETEKIPVEFSSDQAAKMHEKSPTSAVTRPASTANETAAHREPQRSEDKPTERPLQVAPTRKTKERTEGEQPKIVTTRPIHIVPIEESNEFTTTANRRGTTMGIRVVHTPTSTTTDASLSSIFDESAFGTVTAPIARSTGTPEFRLSTLLYSQTTTGTPLTTSTTSLSVSLPKTQNRAPGGPTATETSSPSATRATFATLPEESEEETVELEKGMIMKGRPTNFGDQNMMKAEIVKSMLEDGVTEPTTIAQAKTTETQPLGATPAETVHITTEFASTLFAATETSQGMAISSTDVGSLLTETTPYSPATSTATTAFSTESSSTSTEAPPFEVPSGMFEQTVPTVAHRQPVTEETSTMAEETNPFYPPTEEGQPQLTSDGVSIQKGSCPTPNDESNVRRGDVLFLLDSSNSFNEQKFMHAIQLILDTVQHFRNIGPNGTQVSLVQYNTEPYLEFSLRKHNCLQWLMDDIADTDYMQGGNMLGKAVEKVARFAFTKNRGDRPDAENILVVLTNGQSDDKIQEPVEIAKKNNVTVLVIATLEANPRYIMELAGDMDNVFRFHADPHKTLPLKLAERINSLASTIEPVQQLTTASPPTTTIRILGTHEMFTIALPSEDEENSIEIGVPAPWVGPDKQNVVHLQCTHLGFKINLKVPAGYEGVALVKGYEATEECQKDIHIPKDTTNALVEFFVSSKTCGVARTQSINPPGQNYSLILQLVHHGSLVTGGDKAYLLQCFIGNHVEETELATNITVMKGELMIAETISLNLVPPTCAYSIRTDSPDGPVVKNAFVGQTVYHRWDCDGGEETNSVYGMQVHSCYASDDVDMKFPIVDVRGCSSDLALISDPKYYDDRLTAYAESKAFAFQKAESLQFMCKLSLCTRDGDGCEGVTPPVCNGNSPELLVTRRLRHQNAALEGALSSALSTKVDMTSKREPVLSERILNLFSSKGSLLFLSVLVVVAVLGTVLLSRYARHPVDATTTCSDPETFISPPTSPVPPHDGLSSQSPPSSQPAVDRVQSNKEEVNRRLDGFMKDFDRSKYV